MKKSLILQGKQGVQATCTLLAPGERECVKAGGDSEPPLAPFMGGATCNLPIELAPLKLAPPAKPKTTEPFSYVWRVKTRLPERKGSLCRVLVRSKMNSCLVEFQDGQRYVTSRQYMRKANPPIQPKTAQLTFNL